MLEIITDFRVLMLLAHELGKAKRTNDEELIKLAQKRHDEYKELCLKSDKMNLGVTFGGLS